MTGDRHHSEIIKVNRPGNYPLIDITISPLTSGTHNFGPEKDNPYRVAGIDQKQNFGKISVSGSKGDRKLAVVYKDLNGNEIVSWSVNEKELKAK
jgi:alkaline phosphatase D